MFNRMRALPVPAAGVVVASGGNAGIAVATAARALGVRCEVFLPELSTAAKRAALAALGATVSVQGAIYAEALAACLARQQETGALLMHAYDQPEVVVGAGTLAAEIEDQAGCPARPRAGQRGRRRPDRRHRGLVRRALPRRGAGARGLRPRCMRRAPPASRWT
jgi:threonine dehydratase